MTVIIQFGIKIIIGSVEQMGGSQSQFQNEFFKKFSFIQLIDDPVFGLIKIYRKLTVKYDYTMILELPLNKHDERQQSNLEERLMKIRNFQNETTLRVYHYKFQPENQVECRQDRMLIYAEYINRTLADYLSALRSSPNFIFTIDELIYILSHVAKGCLVLSRMAITRLELKPNKIYLSPDGEVLLCPLLYVVDSLNATENQEEMHSLRHSYQKYSVSELRHEQFPLKEQFVQLLVELAAHLPGEHVQKTFQVHKIVKNSRNLYHLCETLPQTNTQLLEISQMHKHDNLTGQFYATE